MPHIDSQNPPSHIPSRRVRGWLSVAGLVAFPLGGFFPHWLKPLVTSERYDRGLTLVLPGIGSASFINHSTCWGLADGGVETAIEIFDWTTGFGPLFLYHLRGWKRNLRQAQRLADRIAQYQATHPGRPVNLVGHSGGAALSILALERLPPGVNVHAVALLAAAISPGYPLGEALRHVTAGVWNFTTPWDWFYVRLATTVVGTVDGRHGRAAGATGFDLPDDLSPADRKLYETRLFERPWTPALMGSFHLGGHFGGTNRVFVAEQVAPHLCRESQPAMP